MLKDRKTRLREFSARMNIAWHKSLVNCLSSEFDVEFPQTEVAYIAIHLASKKMFKDISESPNLVITE